MQPAMILSFILYGTQATPISKMAIELEISKDELQHAAGSKLEQLCYRAADIRRRRAHVPQGTEALLLKHLLVCTKELNADYEGHYVPVWLERATNVAKIVSGG